MKNFIEVSDEQITKELKIPNKLLIIGNCGSGKTRLINRILRHIENQAETIYLFVTHDLFNHTGDKSYGHIKAERLHIDNLLLNEFQCTLNNTAIEFPYCDMKQTDSRYDQLYGSLLVFIDNFYSLCQKNNKRIVFLTDDVSIEINDIVDVISNKDKFIMTEISLEYIMKKSQKVDPSNYNKLFLN